MTQLKPTPSTELNKLILLTPTGEFRNRLTTLQMILSLIEAKELQGTQLEELLAHYIV